MELNEFWLDSTECITNCKRDSKREIHSKECCLIKYDLFEPYYEEVSNEFIQLGKYRGEDQNFYRYTSMFFFDKNLEKVIDEASEVHVTFELDYSSTLYLGTTNDSAKDKFNNNFLLRGHSFRTQKDLLDKWNDQEGYDELKYHFNCPYVISIYEDLRSAIINKHKTFTVVLNESALKEFKQHNVKGFHLYCHDTINAEVRIKPNCTVSIVRYKNFYDDIINSKNALTVSRKHVYDDKYLKVGAPQNSAFFIFENELEDILNKAEEIKISFNLLWYEPSKEAVLIHTNSNFLHSDVNKDSVVLSSHGFSTEEELYQCKTANELHELDKDNYSIEIHASLKEALERGQTTYSFVLDKDDIDALIRCNAKGFKIGLKNSNGVGFWRMLKTCTIKVLKYREDYTPVFMPGPNSNWININKASLIGHKMNEENGDHCVFYFFGPTMYEKLNAARIQNITVRFYFNKLEGTDDNKNIRYIMCGHNYYDINDVTKEDFIAKANGICEFYITTDVDYIDIILSKEQINFLKNYNGLCFYSKQNLALTGHGDKVSIFIDYIDLSIYTSVREFDSIEYKTHIIEDKMTYENKFIVGANSVGYLYKPFMYMGDNFHDFINKSDVTDIKLLIAADHVNYYDDKASAKSVNISFYTHNLTSNDSNYEAHVYKDLLFKAELGNSKYVEIDLNEQQINLLKNAHGLGAMIEDNINNDFLVLNTFKIFVTYVNIV